MIASQNAMRTDIANIKNNLNSVKPFLKEKETALLSKRLEALGRLAEELRGKAEACCEMDGTKMATGEQPSDHDHGDKQKDSDQHDQPAKPEEGKPAAEPHH